MEDHKFCFTDRSIFVTEDGSSTLRLNGCNEHFHSIHGALNESMHIYIEAGLRQVKKEEIEVLEIGFGTGLNAILTFRNVPEREVSYHTIEAYPLTEEELNQLNYPEWMSSEEADCFHRMHRAESGKRIYLSPGFTFQKEIGKLENFVPEKNRYDVVYFDAFSPELQPELWEEEIFRKLYEAMQPQGILTTYCAKGAVKRAMKKAGFDVEGIPGPKGKREITRCVKK